MPNEAERPQSPRRRYWPTGLILLALACLGPAAVTLHADFRPPAGDEDPSLGLSESCIQSPDIACVNPACHPQPPDSADSREPTLIVAPECIESPTKTCTDAACHPQDRAKRKIAHPLFLEERCGRCHVRPTSPWAPILKDMPAALCMSCHLEVGWDMQKSQLAHPPGKRHCTTCHNPHESRVRNLLHNENELLECAQCHEDFLTKATTMPYHHRHFDERVECGFCHYAHRRGMGKYVRENTMESCLTCHDLPIQHAGRVLENVAKSLEESPVTHGAIRGGTCPHCHTPHGSVQPALLKGGYPAGAYEIYSPEHYSLCLGCHGNPLVESAKGRGVTEFRSETLNLHRHHVIQIGRGRACHLCHEPHASQRPRLLRERLRFGIWNSPFEFTTLSDGGRCLTPCHREKEYRRRPLGVREIILPNAPAQPTPEPAE